MYDKHDYVTTKIWNLDKFGAQTNKNGLDKVLTKKGARRIPLVVFNEQEWMTVLTTTNAIGEYLLNFYMFKGLKKIREYVAKYG